MIMTTVFISYSRDSESHKERVRDFVRYLRKYKIKVKYDVDAILGLPLTDFMEEGVKNSDYVLMCCTPMYKKKADGRLEKKISGVGYENTIITGEVFKQNNHEKFIPILFEGTWESSVPYWAISKLGIDLTKNNVESEMARLIETLKKKPKSNNKAHDNLLMNQPQKPIKKRHKFAISIVASIATIIVALFGDNLIGRLVKEEDSTSENIHPTESFSAEDYVKSDTDLSITELFNKLWEDSNYIRSEYVKNLINTGITRYNNEEFSYAGALFEQAIKEGDEGVTARNNLSFMIRRHEYVSKDYELDDLLEQCRESGGAFALINYAMYLVSLNEWEMQIHNLK